MFSFVKKKTKQITGFQSKYAKRKLCSYHNLGFKDYVS